MGGNDTREGLNERPATLQTDGELSCMYIYVADRGDFPKANQLFTEERETTVNLDYERGTGRLLGVEVIVVTAPVWTHSVSENTGQPE